VKREEASGIWSLDIELPDLSKTKLLFDSHEIKACHLLNSIQPQLPSVFN